MKATKAKKLFKISRDKVDGITLIALVITIIILLILAGISISALTESGLFTNAKSAKEKSLEAEVKEKIQLLLSEYQIEKVNNEELTLLEFFEQKKNEGEIDDVKDNENETIDVKLKGYTVTLNVEQQAITDIKISNDIKISYEFKSYENNKFKILIKISDEYNGIDTIEYPSGDETITKTYDGQKEIEIENYEVEEGVDYKFVAKNTKGINKEEIINLKKPATPEIGTVDLEYFTLTLSGINIPEIEINYDERDDFKNYYSFDNGETWNLYTGPIKAISRNVKAKSEHKKCAGLYAESSATIKQSDDALLAAAGDGNLETFDHMYPPDKFIKVDHSCWGKYINIYSETISGGQHGFIYFKNSKTGNNIQGGNFNNFCSVTDNTKLCTRSFKIPDNTEYIVLSSGTWTPQIIRIYEVWCGEEDLSGQVP